MPDGEIDLNIDPGTMYYKGEKKNFRLAVCSNTIAEGGVPSCSALSGLAQAKLSLIC